MKYLALALALTVAPLAAFAQLDRLRATIPGSLHQCENTNMFFFDSGNTRPLTVLLVDPASVPSSLKSGTTSLQQVAALKPLQVIQDIDTPDAQQYNFQLGLANGVAFEVFAFYQDSGAGKAMSLTRTVTTALPGATNCVGFAQTTVRGLSGGATTTTTPATTAPTTTRTTSASSITRSSSVTTPTTMATVPGGGGLALSSISTISSTPNAASMPTAMAKGLVVAAAGGAAAMAAFM